jgi:hypothetical protein
MTPCEMIPGLETCFHDSDFRQISNPCRQPECKGQNSVVFKICGLSVFQDRLDHKHITKTQIHDRRAARCMTLCRIRCLFELPKGRVMV